MLLTRHPQRVTFSANGQVVAQRRKIGTAAPEVFSLHTDHLGSVVAVGNSSGARMADSYAMYEPFGGFLVQPTGTNSSVSDHGFTGQRQICEICVICGSFFIISPCTTKPNSPN